MTPYLWMQLRLLALAGVGALSVWWLVGRSAALARAPLLRLLASLALCAAPLGAGAVAVRVVAGGHVTSQFAFIALGYYAAGFWLPLCAAFAALRRPGRGSRARGLALAAAGVLATGALYALLIEPNRLVQTRCEVCAPGWDPGAPPLRIVHISDLQTVGACARERRAAREINALQPDLIVLTGDYAAGPFWDPEPALSAARQFLSELRAPYGIVCVAGHSESEAMRARIFEGLPVIYLRNEERLLDLSRDGFERRLRLLGTTAVGADYSRFGSRVESGLVTLAVSHVPDASFGFDGLGVDLHLAGHTHGGQICVPFFGPPVTLSSLPRAMARGLHRFGDHWLHVSPGIGMEGNYAPRVRFYCPPSIDLIELRGGGARPEPVPLPPRS